MRQHGGKIKEKSMDENEMLSFINDLRQASNNKKLSNILKCIYDNAPESVYYAMDWNDRQHYYETEYNDLVKETVKELEWLMGE